MQRKAFVLLSGGMDSTTCLYKAIHDYMPENPGINLSYGDPDIIRETLHEAASNDHILVDIPWVEAVSIDYGQRHKKEMEYARTTCNRLGIKHTILDIGNLLSGATIMLSSESTVDVPDIDYTDIRGVSPTYVPFRNGLMLSALTAHAQKYVNEKLPKWHAISAESTSGRTRKTRRTGRTRIARRSSSVPWPMQSILAATWLFGFIRQFSGS
jgi:7-cyano-7-deazaguanine synthase in queuosine biosynthesis